MTPNRARKILKQWRSMEKENERLAEELKRINETVEALYGLTLTPPDGLPHGNDTTNPTEEKALRIMELIDREKARVRDIYEKRANNELLLNNIRCAMRIAKNPELLKRYYYDRVRPMQAVADEMHVSKRTAWRMEADGIKSIFFLL